MGDQVSAESLPPRMGFKGGAIETYSSRTIMLEELSTLLDTLPVDATRLGLFGRNHRAKCSRQANGG